MELRISSSLRMQAVRASFFGLPAANPGPALVDVASRGPPPPLVKRGYLYRGRIPYFMNDPLLTDYINKYIYA